MNIEDITSQIKVGAGESRTILIGVDGYGGSGKSTISEKLRAALSDAYVIGIDDFIVKELLLKVSADEVLFDRTRLKRQILEPISQGRPTTYQKLDWVENKLSEPINVPTTKYVIIEGISSTHPDIAEYYDYKIWVEVPIDVARQRGKQRDSGNENEQHWDLWSSNDLAYQAKYHPEQHADFMIRND